MRLRQDVRFIARCKAFSGEGVREHKIMVTADCQVRVWDDVAGHYTICNSLSDGAQKRLVREAQKVLREMYPS